MHPLDRSLRHKWSIEFHKNQIGGHRVILQKDSSANAVDSDSTEQFEKVPPGRGFQKILQITFGKLIMPPDFLLSI